jgi:hypothetical protein
MLRPLSAERLPAHLKERQDRFLERAAYAARTLSALAKKQP